MSSSVLWILVLGLLHGYDEAAHRVVLVPRSLYLPDGGVQASTWAKNYSRELRDGGEAAVVDFPGRAQRPEPDWAMEIRLDMGDVDAWRFRDLYASSTRRWQALASNTDDELRRAVPGLLEVFDEIQTLGDASRAPASPAEPAPYAFLDLRNPDAAEAIDTAWRDLVAGPLAITYRRWTQLHLLAFDDPARTIEEVMVQVHPTTGRPIGATAELDLWGYLAQAAAYGASSLDDRDVRVGMVRSAATRFQGIADDYESFDDWWRDRGAGPPHSWGVPGFDEQGVASRRIGLLSAHWHREEVASGAIEAVAESDAEPPGSQRSSRRLAATVSGMVLVLAVVALVAWIGPGRGRGDGVTGTTQLVQQTTAPLLGSTTTSAAPATTEPLSPRLVGTIRVGDLPDTPLLAGGFVWVPNSGGDTVTQVRTDGTVERTFRTGDMPDTPLAVGDRLWVPNRGAGTVTVHRLDTGAQQGVINVGLDADTPILSASLVWVPVRSEGVVLAVDPRSLDIVARLETGDNPITPLEVNSALWVANRFSNTVSRIDPATQRVTDTIPVGAEPDRPIAVGSALWVPNRGEGTLTRIDTASRQVTHTVNIGFRPDTPVLVDGNLWIPDRDGNEMVVVDTSTRSVVDRISVDEQPRTPLVVGHSVWVPLIDGEEVVRIDTETVRVTHRIVTGQGPDTPIFVEGVIWVPNRREDTITRIVER
jgi:YVTN family beta-propeller protein